MGVCYCRRTKLYFHSLHQRVLACDRELAFLSPAAPADADLVLRLTPRAEIPPATPWHVGEGSVMERTADGDVVMRFADDTRFLVSADGRGISLLTAPTEYTPDDLAAYALGPVLVLALHLQGAVLLHASAVVMNEKAVLFAGPSGSGKSTTAAILHRHGYRVLADDVTELDGTRALPAVPALRLWPDVLEALYGSAAAFPDRAPSWDKKVVAFETAGQQEIGAVLFLEERRGEPGLRRLAAREGWTRLLADAPTARLPGAEMERKIFDATSTLADRVPMYAFHPPPLERASTLGAWLESELAR